MKKMNALLMAALFCCSSLFAEDWMQRLPDSVYVAVLSIPGAHDAATGSGWEEGMEDLGDAFARTQDLDIATQWSMGVRAFDLRPCVYEDYMNLNHGIVPTSVHFEDALQLLCDSLTAHPSEFVVIHMLHETDGDMVQDSYNKRIVELLGRDDFKDFFVPFKKDLTVGDMRGKILLLSRDTYATVPVGGFFQNWTGSADWAKQTQARIIGPQGASSVLYVQDYSDTHNSGGLTTKVNALSKLLTFSMAHKTKRVGSIIWVFNFASAYSKVESIFGYEVSSSDGYRENATYTHSAILDILREKPAGPTGIVLMDYVGVDRSGDYEVKGKEVLEAIIENNFRYLGDAAGLESPIAEEKSNIKKDVKCFSVDGKCLPSDVHGLRLVKGSDGKVKKVLHP